MMFQTEIGRGLEVSSDRDCHMRNLRCNPIRDSIYDPNRFDSDRDVKSADWGAAGSRGCRPREIIQAINDPNKERSVLSSNFGS